MADLIKVQGVELNLDNASPELRRAWHTAKTDAERKAAGVELLKALMPAMVINEQRPGMLRPDGMFPAAALAKIETSSLRKC